MATELLKEKARDELLRLTKKDTGHEFAKLNEKQQSIAATKFFVREIHNATKTEISEDDLENGIVDGPNDLGCDLIHRDDGQVTIMQAKYRTHGAVEKPETISYFQSIPKRFRDKELNPNKYLRDVLSEVDWENDQFDLYFISFGKFGPQARTVCQQVPNYPGDVADLDQRCSWTFWDDEDLNVELRGVRNLARGISGRKTKLYPIGQKGKRGESSVIKVRAGDYDSYIMALSAHQLTNAYNELEKDALFSLNIRNFIGNTVTNKNIIKTASEDPSHFFLYNNGISCVATKVDLMEGHLEVSGLQVINGAQTVKALVNTARTHKSDAEFWKTGEPAVLVRITEVPEQYGPSATVREKVIQFNNTQNVIKVSDFRSNDDVQANLKSQFFRNFTVGKEGRVPAKAHRQGATKLRINTIRRICKKRLCVLV